MTKGKNRTPIAVIGTDTLKDQLAARLAAPPGPAAIRFSAELDAEWFAQFAAERVVTRYQHGRPVRRWEPRAPGVRNEALDCTVYATAALWGLKAAGLRLDEEAARIAEAPLRDAPGPAPAPAPPRPRVIRSRWLGR
jgi:phage terminase large subunit GpA-like protein